MAWEVEYTDQFEEWFVGLGGADQVAVASAVQRLQQDGPALGRPLVDTIRQSRHHHLKELRPLGGDPRVLFAFDPRRTAILLLGGDKRSRWNEWYDEAVPRADQLYDDDLAELKDEGRLPSRRHGHFRN